MTTTLILIGIGVVLLVAVGAMLFSRARKVREGDAVLRAIAAIRNAEDTRIVVAAGCKTEAPKFANAAARKTQAPIAAEASAHRPEAPIASEPTEKKPVRELRGLSDLSIETRRSVKSRAAEAARHFPAPPVMVGTVVKVDGQRVEIRGLGKLGEIEVLEFPNGVKGVVTDSSEDKVEALLFGEYQTIKEGDLVKRGPQLGGAPHRDLKNLISPDAPIIKFGDSLSDGTAIKKASSEWRSNSYLSGSPDRSDSGGRL